MRIIKPYPENIVEVPVHSDDKVIDQTNLPGLIKRENLCISFKNKKSKKLTVIMMNPSEADSYSMDNTVERLIKFIKKNPYLPVTNESPISGIGKLHIVNLFSVYNKLSPNLQIDLDKIKGHPDPNFFKQFINSNFESVKKAIDNSHYIVLAWGLPDGAYNQNIYFYQIMKILRYIKVTKQSEVFVLKTNQGSLSIYGNPFHPIAKKIIELHRCKINGEMQIELTKE